MSESNKDLARYSAACHAMQSGVAATMNYDPKSTEPKHLRVGVNAAMSDMGGLVKLLISKGVITEDEYFAAIADSMEREVKNYEASLSARLGGDVRLG